MTRSNAPNWSSSFVFILKGPFPPDVDYNIVYAMNRLNTLVQRTDILLAPLHPLAESVFIEILIRLNDLLWNADKIGKRVSFTDDVKIFDKVTDITDAVRECRDAACHMYANSQFIDPDGKPMRRGHKKNCEQLTFTLTFGKVVIKKTANYTIESEYEGELCFFFGAHRLYFERHIIRAFREAAAALFNVPLPDDSTL